jgi:hypothetical protein
VRIRAASSNNTTGSPAVHKLTASSHAATTLSTSASVLSRVTSDIPFTV